MLRIVSQLSYASMNCSINNFFTTVFDVRSAALCRILTLKLFILSTLCYFFIFCCNVIMYMGKYRPSVHFVSRLSQCEVIAVLVFFVCSILTLCALFFIVVLLCIILPLFSFQLQLCA